MISAKLQGRRLVLTVETEADETAIAPFLVDPMSAKAGRELSTRYLFSTEGLPVEDGSIAEDMVAAFGLENYQRADDTLSQSEGELLVQAAYLWQSLGGLESVRALLEVDPDTGEQGGLTSRGKALAVFRLRMVPLLSQIRHRLELARQTLAESSPATGTPSGSGTSESKPAEQLSEPTPATPNPHPAPSPTASA